MLKRSLPLAFFLLLAGGHSWADEPPLRFEIAYATFLGGAHWEEAREAIVRKDGSVLVGALVKSEGLPVSKGAVQPRYAGDDPTLGHGGQFGGDCYLIRLAPDGRTVQAATYFGGSKQERNVYGMALDSGGNVVITSSTRSDDMPTTKGAFQPKYGGGVIDIFVAKLAPDLDKIVWCTYLGGKSGETPRGGLALTKDGRVTIVGSSGSPGFPVTEGALQPKPKAGGDCIVCQLTADGAGLAFSTWLGGSKGEVLLGAAADASGDIYLGGYTHSTDFPVTKDAAQSQSGGGADLFFAKLKADGSKLLYSTYLGGSGNEFPSHPVHLMADGSLLGAGASASADFPTTAGAAQAAKDGKDGYIAKIAPDGKRVAFATVLGGSGGEYWLAPTPGPNGHIYVVGQTQSQDFPVTKNALQPTFGGGKSDGVFAVLSADGTRVLYATYIGGKDREMVRGLALGPDGSVYLVGKTYSQDFPTTEGVIQPKHGGDSDAFVVRLRPVR